LQRATDAYLILRQRFSTLERSRAVKQYFWCER